MKLSVFCCTFLLIYYSAVFAQEIPRRLIEDSTIGWMKIYKFKGAKAPMTVDNKVYSTAQLSLCDSFANWIQSSYIPKGGLGDVKRRVKEKLGLYNQHKEALPQSYGAYSSTYIFLKYNSNRKLVPATSHSVDWGILANGVPNEWAIKDLSSPTQCYFTLPSYESSSSGEQIKQFHDVSQVKNIKPYLNFWVKNIESGGGTDYILLSKDNRQPFVKITKGEFLECLEQAIPRVYEREKRKLIEKEQGNQKNIAAFLKYEDDKVIKRTAILKQTRDKYKDRLNELAMTGAQPSVNDLDVGRDVFSNGYLSDPESISGRMPVYKVDPAMAELCKQDRPQWILVHWWWTPNDMVEKHIHESIINNFNFEYVYNFFFDKEKLQSQNYQPLRSPAMKEVVIKMPSSATGEKLRADKSVHFFDDFSTTVPGKKPVGWRSKLGPDGLTSTVVKLDGIAGNWTTGNYELSPVQLKKPLPQNFTLSYDIVVPQSFTWGAKGLIFQLAKETTEGNPESFIKLKLRPGFDGKDGEATVETKFNSPPGYMNATKWLVAPGFSNNKKYNRIKVTIQKAEEVLSVYIDKTKIVEYEKAIPAALLFNSLAFFETGNMGTNDKYFITDFKITKD